MPDPNYDLTRWIPPLSAGGRRGRTGRSAFGFAVLAVVLLLLIPLVAGGCGMSAAGGLSTTTAATATATTSTPTAATATATAPAAPTTPPTATPTPLPPLQAQILTDGLGSPIAAGTNSPIHDVTCPAGYLVAGGGIRSGYANFTVMSSAPISTTTWEGEVFNTSGSPIYVQLDVVCLKVSGLLSQLVNVALPPVNPSSASAASATCPTGYLVAGGGISSGYANFTHSVDAPGAAPERWDAVVTNHTSGVIYATVRAICLQVSGLHSQIVNADLGRGSPIAAGTNSFIVDLACPAGYLVVGGGIGVNYPNYTVMNSAPISTTTWEGEVFNTSASAMPYQYVYATCLKRS